MGARFFKVFAGRVGLRLWPVLVLPGLLLCGCGGKPKAAKADEGDEAPIRALERRAQTQPAPGAEQPTSALPPDQRKTCFACDGLGLVPCRVIGCRGGKVDCPGGCLKLSQGVWTRMDVEGHNSDELWQKFPGPNGGYVAWNSHHCGEVIAIQNGEAINLGQCKICGGTTKVACQVCAGTGKQTCEVCLGKRYVPLAWTANDNPWIDGQPDLIRLRDGRVLLGKVAMAQGEDRVLRTRDGKTQHVDASEIIPKSEYTATNTTRPPGL